jgi:hypothetical protein
MAAIQYGQFLDADAEGQTGEDDWRIDYTPPDIRSGSWRIHYIPRAQYHANDRCLLSVRKASGEFALLITAGGDEETAPQLVLLNTAQIFSTAIRFNAGAHLVFVLDAVAGTLEVAGTTLGNGVYAIGSTWVLDDDHMRIGGSILGGKCANGFVSLPYAVGSANEGSSSGTGGGTPPPSGEFVVSDIEGEKITSDIDGEPIVTG